MEGQFLIRQIYDDEITYNLIGAAVEILSKYTNTLHLHSVQSRLADIHRHKTQLAEFRARQEEREEDKKKNTWAQRKRICVSFSSSIWFKSNQIKKLFDSHQMIQRKCCECVVYTQIFVHKKPNYSHRFKSHCCCYWRMKRIIISIKCFMAVYLVALSFFCEKHIYSIRKAMAERVVKRWSVHQ